MIDVETILQWALITVVCKSQLLTVSPVKHQCFQDQSHQRKEGMQGHYKQDGYLRQATSEEKHKYYRQVHVKFTHTRIVFPLYSNKREERPTSLPAPRGVSFKRSSLSMIGTSYSALRLTVAMLINEYKRKEKGKRRDKHLEKRSKGNEPISTPDKSQAKSSNRHEILPRQLNIQTPLLAIKSPMFLGHHFSCERDRQPTFKSNIEAEILSIY
jgi:hypothetical protein